MTRWVQGSSNLAINSEPEGLAHSVDVVHGGSVFALGLAVDDQSAAMARAEVLGIERFEAAVGPDEWEIPSLRRVGGSRRYFVAAATRSTMWADEFPHPIVTDGPRTDLLRVDHIARSMQYEEFPSRQLYYCALLEVTKTPQLEIADLMGIVYSQAVESCDHAVRFTLNGSLAGQSFTSRLVQNTFNAGVQRVAFATDDIFTAAANAKAAGLPMLDIGPNYYADIEARFGLDPALLECMAALNILYDRT